MNGISLFLIGTVALTNVGFLMYLLKDHNSNVRSDESTKPKDEPKIETPSDKSPPPTNLIGKSRTVIEDFDKRFEKIEQRFDQMYQLLEKIEGDVKLKDVEFTNPNDAPTQEEISKEEKEDAIKESSARLTPEQEAAAFEDTRIEDVDNDMVSAPSANGASMDEIEEALETAVNAANASSEELAKAGAILDKLKDTEFEDIFATDAKIMNGVMACITESCRINFSEKPPHRPVSMTKRKTTFFIPDNIDDFDPESLFK